MTILGGQTASAAEVKPQLYTYMRELIDRDKHYQLNRIGYRSNFITDGFTNTSRVASSTGWTALSTGGYSRPALYWTSTNASDLIGKTHTLSSTSSYGTGYADYIICETVDEFNDSSVNTSVWDVVTDTGSASDTTEDTAEIRIRAEDNAAPASATEYLRSDNALLDSTYKYLAVLWRANFGNTGGSGGTTTDANSLIFQVDDGSNQVVLFSASADGVTVSSSHLDNVAFEYQYGFGTNFSFALSKGFFGPIISATPHLLEFLYDSNSDIIDVYLDGMFYNSKDVSSVGDLKLGVKATASRATISSTPTASTDIYLNWVRRNKSSPSSSLAFYASADGGSNYTNIGHESETAISNTGTQGKVKLTATISGSEYIHVRGYTAFFR